VCGKMEVGRPLQRNVYKHQYVTASREGTKVGGRSVPRRPTEDTGSPGTDRETCQSGGGARGGVAPWAGAGQRVVGVCGA